MYLFGQQIVQPFDVDTDMISDGMMVDRGFPVKSREKDDGYTLSKVTKNGKSVQDKDTFTVTCLTTPQHMESYPAGKNIVFDGEVKDTWTKCVLKGDAVLAKPEDYMTLR